MGPDEAGFFTGETLLTQSQTRTLLGQGVSWNAEQCPAHAPAAHYAISVALPTLIDRQFYLKSSVEACFFLLGNLPCSVDIDPTSNPDFYVGFYGTVIRNCGLKDMGIEQVVGQP